MKEEVDMPNLDRETVFEKTREILVDTLGLDHDEVTPEASLIYDLGAESIDFLDISFRLEKAFGIKFPTRQLGQVAEVAKRTRMDTICQLLEKQYQIKITENEKEELADLDTKVIIDRIGARYKIKLESDTIERGIQIVAKDILEHLRALGFNISTSDPQNMIEVTMEDNPATIQEKVSRLLTVESLVDLVAASQPASSQQS
jgi:acyl carrier protein